MTDSTAQPISNNRWAPWWLYVVLIVAGNWARQAVLPPDTVPTWGNATLALATAATLFVLITVLHRVLRRPSGTVRRQPEPGKIQNQGPTKHSARESTTRAIVSLINAQLR